MSEDTSQGDTSPDLEQMCDELFTRDQDLRATLEVIVAAYRVHHIATVAVERTVKGEGLPPQAAKMLATAGAAKAKASYYTIETLINSIESEVLPFLKAEFQIQMESRRSNDLENKLAERTVCSKPHIVIKMPGNITVELDRGHIMLVVGDKVKMVKGLADLMFSYTTYNNDAAMTKKGTPFNVINLSSMPDPPQIKQLEARIMRIPLSKWQYMANSHAKLKMLLFNITSQLAEGKCDLIIVDDGNQLFNGVHGREPSYDVEDGLRPLRRIAAELSAGVVCLAPVPQGTTDYVDLLRATLQKHTEFIEV